MVAGISRRGRLQPIAAGKPRGLGSQDSLGNEGGVGVLRLLQGPRASIWARAGIIVSLGLVLRC